MTQKEGEFIAQTQIEESTSQTKIPSSFVEEWMHILPSSNNAQSTNDQAFRYQFVFCRDAEVLDRNGYELFWLFYRNIMEKVLVYNPWIKNLGNLIMLEEFVDIDLVKVLIKCYNPISKSFH